MPGVEAGGEPGVVDGWEVAVPAFGICPAPVGLPEGSEIALGVAAAGEGVFSKPPGLRVVPTVKLTGNS